MKRTDKKGFTIVELVIVIAVIAILAAVLIPNLSKMVRNAKESSDIQLIRNMNTAMQVESVGGTKRYDTAHDAITAATAAGYDLTKISLSDKENTILWDEENQCFAYLRKGETTPEYVPNSKKDNTNTPAEKLWKVETEVKENGDYPYSVYWNGGDVATINVKNVGFDAGIANIGTVNYTGDAGKTVVIRTNSYSTILTIDAIDDSVKHYDLLGVLTIENVKGESYHEFGKVKNVTIKNGRFVAEEGSEIETIVSETGATVDTSKCTIWNTPYEYSWSEDYKTCTARRTDKSNLKADETETVEAEIVRIEPTATSDGSITYTAKFTNPAFETQTKTEVLARLQTEEEKLLSDINAELAAFETKNNRKPYTMHEALTALGSKRDDVMAHADTFLWDGVENKFYTEEDVKAKVAADSTRKKYEFWKITSSSISSDYSNYLSDDFSKTSITTLRTGLDVGNNRKITEIVYSANSVATREGAFILRTAGNEKLTINQVRTLTHYGTIKTVSVSGDKSYKNSLATYIEKGIVLEQITLNRKSTIDLSGTTEKSARVVVVSNSEGVVIGNNKTPVCYTTSSKPNGISGVDNGNDIGKVYPKGLTWFDEGFGTQSNPFVIKSSDDWSSIDKCDTTAVTIYFVLHSGFTIDKNVTTLARNAKVVLDLNGFTVTLKNDSMIQIGAKGLTIKDSKGYGSISKAETNGTRGLLASFANNATVTIEGGNFVGNYLVGTSANAETGITITVKGGTFKLDSFKATEVNLANIVVEGGTFNADPTEFVDSNAYSMTESNGTWTVSKKSN